MKKIRPYSAKQGSLIASRFSTLISNPKAVGSDRNKFSKLRQFGAADVERAVRLLTNHSLNEVMKLTGIDRQLLKIWRTWNMPLHGPRYVGAKNPVTIVNRARLEMKVTGEVPLRALHRCWIEAGLPRNSLKVYLSMERIALPSDFVIYADPAAQVRVARMWAGEINGPAQRQKPAAVPPPAPAQAGVPVPAAPASRPAPTALLQQRRRLIGYQIRVSRTTLPR